MPELIVKYKYSAFISYHHNDCKELGRDWANWIKQLLESFRTAPELAGEISVRYGDKVPASLDKVFLDQSMIAGGVELSPTLVEALKESRVLIVLCSPDAAASEWVNLEIIEFKKLGRVTAIVPIILSGEPNTERNPELECLPKALRFNVGPDGAIDLDSKAELSWVDFRGPPAVVMKGSPPLPTSSATSVEAYRELLLSETRLREETVDECCATFGVRFKEEQIMLLAGVLGLDKDDVTKVCKLREDEAIKAALAQQEIEKKRKKAERDALIRRVFIGAAFVATAGLLVWRNPFVSGDNGPDPDRSKPKVQLFTSDGKTPLQGSTVTASHWDLDPYNSALINFARFGFVSVSPDGSFKKNGHLTLEYTASSVDDDPALKPPGRILVDPTSVSTDPGSWNLAIKLTSGKHPTYTYYSTFEAAVAPKQPESSGDGLNGMPFCVGKRGVIPAGLTQVRLRYCDPDKTDLVLAEAEFTLDIEPAPWPLDPKLQKIQLLNAEGTAPLDSEVIQNTDVYPRGDWNTQREQLSFSFRPTVKKGAEAPATAKTHLYALNARFSDDKPSNEPQFVISSDFREVLKRTILPQGDLIEIGANANWPVSDRLDFPWFFYSGPNGLIPKGECEFGILIESKGEAIYRSKIKVRMTKNWSLSERETKLIVTDLSGKPLEDGHSILATRAMPYEWQGRKSDSGLVFGLRFKCKSEPVNGPWLINYYLKATHESTPPTGTAMMSVGWPLFPKPTAEGFTFVSSWNIGLSAVPASAPVFAGNATVDFSNLTFYTGNDELGQGSIPAGLHDIGIEILDKDKWCIHRGMVKLEVK